MDSDLQNLANQARALPDEQRAALAATLIGSLDSKNDENAEKLWQDEVPKRVAQIDRGEADLKPSDQVIAQMKLKDG